MRIKITAKEARKIANDTGYPLTPDLGKKTYYLTDKRRSGVWEYDSREARDAALARDKQKEER